MFCGLFSLGLRGPSLLSFFLDAGGSRLSHSGEPHYGFSPLFFSVSCHSPSYSTQTPSQGRPLGESLNFVWTRKTSLSLISFPCLPGHTFLRILLSPAGPTHLPFSFCKPPLSPNPFSSFLTYPFPLLPSLDPLSSCPRPHSSAVSFPLPVHFPPPFPSELLPLCGPQFPLPYPLYPQVVREMQDWGHKHKDVLTCTLT